MPGRTVTRYIRVYVDEFDMSGYSRNCGPLTVAFDEAEMTTYSDAIKGYLPNHPNVTPGTLNTVLDNTATVGSHIVLSSVPAERIMTVAFGDRADPIKAAPVFTGNFLQSSYQATEDGGAVVATIPFQMWGANSTTIYAKPWGSLLHPLAAVTAVNSAVGIGWTGAAASTSGGYMTYHVTASDGTATIKVQDSAVNADGDFGDLVGATTGVVDFSSGGSGMVELGNTATVKRYLRWQIVLGTATTITFVLSFVRGF
ncbi:MAG: hypothetical protein ACYS30_25935 [Planctomycetota bacterium]|jgi:hypothetical protein